MLYDTPFRGYDAQLGRFWQVDLLADHFTGINTYQFGYNNPVVFNDPTGLLPDGPPRKNRGVKNGEYYAEPPKGPKSENVQHPVSMVEEMGGPSGNAAAGAASFGLGDGGGGGNDVMAVITRDEIDNITPTPRTPSFIDNSLSNLVIETQYYELIDAGKFEDAVKLVISHYLAQETVVPYKSKFLPYCRQILIVKGSNATMTTGNKGVEKLGEAQTITLMTGALAFQDFGWVVRALFHEEVHTEQKAKLIMTDRNEREFLAHYEMFSPSYMPSMQDKTAFETSYKAITSYYSKFDPEKQKKYSQEYMYLSNMFLNLYSTSHMRGWSNENIVAAQNLYKYLLNK